LKRSLIFILILFFAVTSCTTEDFADYTPYNEIPDNYSLDDAKNDNLVVYENGNITAGQSVWDNFVAQTKKDNPCFVRLAFYYTLGDPERYSPEHYEEIKDDYPVLYIQDLKFDGKNYNLYFVEDGHEYSFTYKYMKKIEGKPSSSTAVYSDYIYYVLLNDDTVTAWEQIERSIFSSYSGDFIDYKKVYSYIN
jgi:hypothetical protein